MEIDMILARLNQLDLNFQRVEKKLDALNYSMKEEMRKAAIKEWKRELEEDV